jgi:HPt (histidine-containing phosphotransfer) domain-containing protein
MVESKLKLKSYPILNYKRLTEITENDSDFTTELLQAALHTFTQEHTNLINNYKNLDWLALEKTAHKIKSASTNIGASRIGVLSQEIEILSKAHSPNLLPYVDSFSACLDDFISEINL